MGVVIVTVGNTGVYVTVGVDVGVAKKIVKGLMLEPCVM